jgi:hypothetical protein
MQITVEMTSEDFTCLWEQAMAWAGYEAEWAQQLQAGRFEIAGDPEGRAPSLLWKHAYWVDGGYADVVLARAYLRARGEGCVLARDLTEQQWVVLTDYTDPAAAGAAQGG